MKRSMLATLCVAVIATAPHAAPLDRFSSYIAFGDSLTDDGKLGELAPPSLGGRFSNGITYAEHIAAEFARTGRISANLAIGGATAEDDNENLIPGAEAIGTFNGQIATFGQQLDLTPLGAVLGATPLVSVLFGANDLLQDLTESTFFGEIGQNAADAVAAGIMRIAALRPELDTFLLANLPDLGLTPRYAGGPDAGIATVETNAFNARLAENATALRAAGLDVVEFDLNNAFGRILNGSLGIANVIDQCTASFQAFNPADNCALGPRGIDLALADDFLFIDDIHPNRVAHAAIGEQIETALAPIPLPAGLPLMLVGLASFGFLARRKRRA